MAYLGARCARLAVVVTPEGRQGEWEGEEENYHGGDEEAEDAVVLAVVLPAGTQHALAVAQTNPVCPVLHEDIVEPPSGGIILYCVMLIPNSCICIIKVFSTHCLLLQSSLTSHAIPEQDINIIWWSVFMLSLSIGRMYHHQYDKDHLAVRPNKALCSGEVSLL